MVGAHALILANVRHARQRPRPHSFSYKIFYLYVALKDIAGLKRRFFSVNRWNIFAFHEKDHGPRDGTPLEPWIRDILAVHGVAGVNGDIFLMTLPRVFGYVFNPVSFWFCFDREQRLRAVLSEVSNTFGEHHCYLSYNDDGRPIAPGDWLESDKLFHVSPFMDVEGHYRFRFQVADDKIDVAINYYDKIGLMLTTGVSGRHALFTARELLKCAIRYPLVTFKIIVLIHMQAVRLLLKGARYRPKPPPPTMGISR